MILNEPLVFLLAGYVDGQIPPGLSDARSASRAAGLRLDEVVLVPLLDLLMLYAWVVPFFSNSVSWRGYRARIDATPR